MGDAKKRGTFDQRQAAAIEREQERLRNLPPPRRPSVKHAAFMAAIAGMSVAMLPSQMIKDQQEAK